MGTVGGPRGAGGQAGGDSEGVWEGVGGRGIGDHKGPIGVVSVVKISHKCFKRSSKCENL